MHDSQGNLVPATLPHMYEHAFRAQSVMEKQAAKEENRGGSGAAFRDYLRLKFNLSGKQFLEFENSSLRFDRVDQDIKKRIHAEVEAGKAAHLKTQVFSEDAKTKIHNLIAERVSAANEEIQSLHQALGTAATQQLDTAVVSLYSEAQRAKTENKSRQTMVGITLNGLKTKSPSPLFWRIIKGDDYDYDDDDDDDDDYDDYGGGGIVSPSTDYTPVITGIAPNTWDAGTTQSVTISGEYFGTNSPTLTLSPSTGISYTLVSYNDTQIVASVTVVSGIPDEAVSVEVTNNGYGGASFYSSSGSSATSSAVGVTVVATCFAQLKYRAVYISGFNSGKNHSFWYIQDSNGTQWIIDAGPSGTCPSCGYLNDWITEGTVSSHYNQAPSLDSSAASTAWRVGPSSGNLCKQVDDLYDYAEEWGDNTTTYVMDGAPNSNTFSHDAGTDAGFTTMTAPPNAPGW
jgi:hypothetical protein